MVYAKVGFISNKAHMKKFCVFVVQLKKLQYVIKIKVSKIYILYTMTNISYLS